MNPRDYAIVIGINNYPQFRNLKGAEDDATELRNWLISRDGGGLPPDNCQIVTSNVEILSTGSKLAFPIRKSIDDAISNIINSTKGIGANRLYFYFSGHGIGITFDDGGLCLAGWSDATSAEGLSIRKYKLFFEGLQIFKELVFFFDCCRLKFTQNLEEFLPPSLRQFSPKSGSQKVFVAYGSEFNEASFESEVGTGEVPEIRGNFTRAILEALKEKKAIKNNTITSFDLKKYLETRVSEIAKEKNQVQKADFGVTDDDIVFFQDSLPPPITLDIKIKSFTDGEVTLVDQTNQTIGAVSTPFPSSWLINVPSYNVYALKHNNISETQKIIAVFPNASMNYEY